MMGGPRPTAVSLKADLEILAFSGAQSQSAVLVLVGSLEGSAE